MSVTVVEQDVSRGILLEEFLEYLYRRDLEVLRDSHVAYQLGLEVSNTKMASAVHSAIKRGWVVRCRDSGARDYYNNPITFKLTKLGRDVFETRQSASTS